MFIKKNFAHLAIIGTTIPRLFAYCNMDEKFSEIIKPGYFNSEKLTLTANSFIKIICKDAIAEIVVDGNFEGNLTIKKDYLLATPHAYARPQRKKRGRPAKKIDEVKLAETG